MKKLFFRLLSVIVFCLSFHSWSVSELQKAYGLGGIAKKKPSEIYLEPDNTES
jgi:hypothetical protein